MTNTSGKLTEEQRKYVIHRLAAFDSPSAVQEGLREEFGVEITRQCVEFYDPTKRKGARLHEKWKSLFHATRLELRKGGAEIGASRVAKNAGKLTEEQKEYVIHRLAAFDSPSAVQEGLREEFGVEIACASVQFYDPTKRAGARLHEKWKSLFHATREELRKGSAEIGASHALVRIRWRERMALKAMDGGNSKLANDILDSIAKEVGDGFGNRHRHLHWDANGAPRVATINITGRPEPESASQAVGRLPKPRD
jgi:hypothetical protein